MVRIGFDIGGTNVKAGVVDNHLNILAELIRPFPSGAEYGQVIMLMESMMKEMLMRISLNNDAIEAIGVAVPGSLDIKNEVVVHAYNLGFHNVPLKMEMENKFKGIPVFLANDANAAALGELYKGAFAGCNTAVLVTLGTGVGGGLILGGKLFNGGLGHGVEPGHMRLVHKGKLCSCGNYGCVETVCSAAFFKNHELDAKEVIDSAKKGNKKSLEIFNEYVEYLSDAVVSIAVLLDPEVIAIGGGISQAGEFLLNPLRILVEEKSFFKFPHKIVAAKLGNKAGFMGAAMLGKEQQS